MAKKLEVLRSATWHGDGLWEHGHQQVEEADGAARRVVREAGEQRGGFLAQRVARLAQQQLAKPRAVSERLTGGAR